MWRDLLRVILCSLKLVSFSLPLEIDCGKPLQLPNTDIVWDNTTVLGSKVYYKCKKGFQSVGERNFSQCTITKKWENITFECKGKYFIVKSSIPYLLFMNEHSPWMMFLCWRTKNLSWMFQNHYFLFQVIDILFLFKNTFLSLLFLWSLGQCIWFYPPAFYLHNNFLM